MSRKMVCVPNIIVPNIILVAKDLEVGDDDDNSEEAKISGTVTAVTDTSVTISPSDNSAPITLTVDSTTEIKVNGQDAMITDIQVGDPIEAEYNPTTLVANKLEVGEDDNENEDAEVSGTVAAVTNTSVTINPSDNSAAITLIVNSSTEIEVEDEDATIADVQVGEPIKARYDPTTLVASRLEVG